MRSASTLASVGLLAGVLACAPASPPVAVAPPAASYVAPPLAPTIAPAPLARWVETSSFNDIGPKTKEGTSIVLGGRRGLITPDGTLRVPSTPGPEPIEELIEVPTPSGTRLVGRGVSTLYAFADILAEPKVLARSAAPYVNIDPGPAMIAAWSGASDRPTFVDVETGRETKLGVLPVLPLRSVSFVDAKKGAGIFAIAGIATTTDGGATWAPIVDANGGAFSAKRLAPRDGLIEARIDDDGLERQVDPVTATLGDPTPHATPDAGASAIERWLARTHRDPLEVAVSDGVAMSSGAALVTSQGLVAKVDLVTGSILDVVDLGASFAAHACSIAPGGGKAWVACESDSRMKTIRLTSLALGDGPLEAAPMQSIGTTTDLRSSSSGGVMLLGPCQPAGDGNACVLQPDGKWRTLDVPRESSTFNDPSAYGSSSYGYYGYGYSGAQTPVAYGVGPLGDGGVAYLTNFHDDTPPDDDAGADAAPASPYGYYGGYTPPPPPKIQLVVIEGSGMHRKLPPIDFAELKSTQLRFAGKLEEDVDHTLRIMLQDSIGAVLLVQPPTGPAMTTRIEGAKSARLHGSHGIAIGTATLMTSSDSGATWSELPTPPHILATTTASSAYGLSQTDYAASHGGFDATDIGFHILGHLRIGWGELDPSDATLTAPAPEVTGSQSNASGPSNRLVCTTSGTSDAVGLGLAPSDLDKVFGVTPTPSGSRRTAVRAGAAGTSSTLLEIEGPESARSPTKWRLHWLNAYDVGARPRVWTGEAPKGAAWYANIVGVASAGERIAALLRSDARVWVLRATHGGAGELTEVAPSTSYFSVPMAIGVHAGDPVAWLDSTTLFAMPASGGSATAIASYGAADRASMILGAPSKSGIPLYVSGRDWGAIRSFAAPSSTKRTPPSDAFVPAALDGWIDAPDARSEVRSVPACDAKSRGTDLRLAEVTLPLDVDGTAESSVYSGAATVRVGASSMCLATLTEMAYVGGMGTPSAGGHGGPVGFLRADLVSKRAEGGDAGGQPHARGLSCKVEAN